MHGSCAKIRAINLILPGSWNDLDELVCHCRWLSVAEAAIISFMAQVDFATTLPEHALAVMRERARRDGLTPNDWLARAIYDKATRDSLGETAVLGADTARSGFIVDSEAERLRHFHRAESA
jgi:hypothetical protein